MIPPSDNDEEIPIPENEKKLTPAEEEICIIKLVEEAQQFPNVPIANVTTIKRETLKQIDELSEYKK